MESKLKPGCSLTQQLILKKGLYDSKDELYKNNVIMRIYENKGVLICSSRKQFNRYREIKPGNNNYTKEHLDFLKEYNAYFAECNGLIMSTGSYDILCVPPVVMTKTIDIKSVEMYLQENAYGVFEAKDGTTFNIYWNDKWTIATTNSVDIENVIWRNKTYKKCLEECLQVVYGENSVNKLFDSLDKKYCYSIGISHPELQPLSSKECWFIQKVCLDINSEHYMKVDYIKPNNMAINQQTPLPINNLNYMLQMGHAAYENFKNKGTRHYGYIIKSAYPKITGAYSHIFIQSTLYSKLIQYYYSWRLTKESILNKYNRFYYVLLVSYLDVNRRHAFYDVLFKDFNVFKVNITKLVESVVDKMYDLHKSSAEVEIKTEDMLKVVEQKSNVKFKDSLTEIDQLEVSQILYTKMKTLVKDNICKIVIRNFVEHESHINLLYRFFTCEC